MAAGSEVSCLISYFFFKILHEFGFSLSAILFAFLRYSPYLSCGLYFGGFGSMTILPHLGQYFSLRVYSSHLGHL